MNILKLVLKDFRANWAYQLDSMVLLFALSTLFIYIMLLENAQLDPEVVIYFMMMLMSTSIVSLLFMKMDELYKMDELFVSLPVTRTEIVIGKYLSSIIQVLLALPVHFMGVQLGFYFHGSLKNPELAFIYNPLLWIAMGSVILLFKSYAYPFYFKFGLSIGVAIHSVIQFLLLVLFILSSQLFNLQLIINKVVERVSTHNGYLVFAILAMALIVLMSLSIALSSKIYKNKAI